MNRLRRVVLSGCSGGGKSTLLAELARRGFTVVEEPGRRVVLAEAAAGGDALPWADRTAFLRKVWALAALDLAAMRTTEGPVFFDRGLVDAAAALEALTGEALPPILRAGHAYDGPVFMAPPWPEIYATDTQRRHGFDDAVREYERLMAVYPRLGYDVVPLPKLDPSQRADFILGSL